MNTNTKSGMNREHTRNLHTANAQGWFSNNNRHSSMGLRADPSMAANPGSQSPKTGSQSQQQ